MKQAELKERKRQQGQKQTALWLDKEMQEQLASLSGMNKSQLMTTALKLGFYTMGLIKERELSLYFDLIEGEFETVEQKLDHSFLQEPTIHATSETTNQDILDMGKQAYELQKLGFSQKDIGEKLGKDRTTISRYIKKFKKGQ